MANSNAHVDRNVLDMNTERSTGRDKVVTPGLMNKERAEKVAHGQKR
jgi:hypothetical protein